MKHALTLGALLFLTGNGAVAAECLTSSAVPVLLVSSTSKTLTLDGDRIPPKAEREEYQLICARFDRNRSFVGVEYVDMANGKNEFASLNELSTTGHESYRSLLGFKGIHIATATCSGCVPGASRIVLTLGVLNTFRIFDTALWAYPQVTVTFHGDRPVVDYRGTPFNVVTLKAIISKSGGAKQMRISRCESADVASCLKSEDPEVRHLGFVPLTPEKKRKR